jgi:ribonuclease HI
MRTIYIDGSGWSGKRSACCIYYEDTGLKQLKIYEEEYTNNEMEYQALIDTLSDITNGHTNNGEEVTIVTDSQLLERQLSGQYEVKADNLKPLYKLAKTMMGMRYFPVHIKWVPREENKAGVYLEQVLKKI